jgi:hypothetical protein
MPNSRNCGCRCGGGSQTDVEIKEPSQQVATTEASDDAQIVASPAGTEETREQSADRGRGRRSEGCCC